MRAETYRALDAYKEKTGKKWEGDLSKVTHSQEVQLIADIQEAIRNAKPKRSASKMVRVPSREERAEEE